MFFCNWILHSTIILVIYGSFFFPSFFLKIVYLPARTAFKSISAPVLTPSATAKTPWMTHTHNECNYLPNGFKPTEFFHFKCRNQEERRVVHLLCVCFDHSRFFSEACFFCSYFLSTCFVFLQSCYLFTFVLVSTNWSWNWISFLFWKKIFVFTRTVPFLALSSDLLCSLH